MKQLVRASSASSLMPNPTLLTTRWVVFKHVWPQSIAGNIFYSEAQSTPTHISWKHFHDMMLLVNDFFLLCFNENADGDLMISPSSNGLLFAVFHIMDFFFFLAVLHLHCCIQAFSSCSAEASHCGGLSCWEVWALGPQASAVAAREHSSCGSWALERRLSSCGAQA